MVAPVTPVETGTPVDPGKTSGDEAQRHSMTPGGAAGCRHAAGALSFLKCFLPAFPCCHPRNIDSCTTNLERKQDFPRTKRSIQ
jgi:hypothetical protein